MKRTYTMCKYPDRDEPKIACGYPLPCPVHTVMLDLTTKPPVLIQPITRPLRQKDKRRLNTIAVKLAK